jgi:hypothetical protein
MKKPSHRVFDYPPRFYKPETDETEKRKKRLGFKRKIKNHRSRRSPMIWIILAIILIFIYLKLSGVG